MPEERECLQDYEGEKQASASGKGSRESGAAGQSSQCCGDQSVCDPFPVISKPVRRDCRREELAERLGNGTGRERGENSWCRGGGRFIRYRASGKSVRR